MIVAKSNLFYSNRVITLSCVARARQRSKASSKTSEIEPDPEFSRNWLKQPAKGSSGYDMGL